MNFYSTNNKNLSASFSEAVIKGIANDGGLFMPSFIPMLSESFFNTIDKLTFQEIAFLIAQKFIEDEIPQNDLRKIIEESISFNAPLVRLSGNISILELFHGPTLAFKDFGARFMAKTLSFLIRNENNHVTILVATSGDTGSAVANGFYRVEGINVILLYPGNKVSEIQEMQLTTLGENITALKVDGTFDDCQRLVKEAFVDREVISNKKLSSANSINIARLIPQSFYYFKAFAEVKNENRDLIFSVPSGNLGNLTAGLIAKEMGLPVYKFIAASNANDVFPKFLETSYFEPKPSIKTFSNAMDVGNPSNFARIIALYNGDYSKIKNNIYGASFSDTETVSAIKEMYSKYHYTIDPHGAVGYLAIKNYMSLADNKNISGIVLETAHPSKFPDVVYQAINTEIEMPARLLVALKKEKKSIPISKDYSEFKQFLLQN
ncbi:MAG TPA: threonine synthase [Ignavibacteriaceae bacterium]|nr:threonine synthase [Ignavibacteriaceae bacterium]